MKPFHYMAPSTLAEAIQQNSHTTDANDTTWLAGGTTLIDLMKLNVLTPSKVIAIKPLLDRKIEGRDDRIVIGAGCTMAQVADHELIKSRLPLIRHALILAASPQIRNMATIGGNLLQRTRWPYYRHTDFPDPNEAQTSQAAGSPEHQGVEVSSMAILGNANRFCGTYPGDFGVALLALEGELHLQGTAGERTVPARQFFIEPNGEKEYATQLKPNELITAVSIPLSKAVQQSVYLKVRERSSYAFALASAAVAVEFAGQGEQATMTDAKVALGGLASIPWASPAAERVLRGRQASDEVFREAAEAALKDAQPPEGLEWKVTLARRVFVRALQQLRDGGVPDDRALWAFQHGRS